MATAQAVKSNPVQELRAVIGNVRRMAIALRKAERQLAKYNGKAKVGTKSVAGKKVAKKVKAKRVVEDDDEEEEAPRKIRKVVKVGKVKPSVKAAKTMNNKVKAKKVAGKKKASAWLED